MNKISFLGKLNLVLLLIMVLSLAACGAGGEDEKALSISGTVITGNMAKNVSSPLFIAIAKSNDITSIMDNPGEAIIDLVVVNDDGTFFIDLTDTGLAEGDEILIFAFIDNDYDGGVPFLDPGDIVGFYTNTESLKIGYTLQAGANTGITIEVNRPVYSFDATVSGTIEGDESGEVTLIAYAGEITSSDFTKLDFDGLIGYRHVTKGAAPMSYEMDILPYGYDVPIHRVYIFALLDVNGNSELDGGDRIGYYSVDDDGYPSPVVINEGTLEGIDVGFHMKVMEPSGIPMSLKGSFTPPPGYDADAPPIYVIVAKVDYPDILFNDPISAIKYFEKMPPGEFTFNIDLSETDLMPGDEVMLIALWDRDGEGGFPRPTRGDKLGIEQNKEKYAFIVPLQYGVNAIPGDGYEFKLSKWMYEFDSSILWALDMSRAGSFDPDLAQIIVLALHVDGLTVSFQFPNKVNVAVDMDYVLAFRTLPATEYDYIGDGTMVDPDPPRVLDILPALYEGITVYEESTPPDPLIKGEDVAGTGEKTAYLVAILDKDGDGELDIGSDEIGYYSSGTVTIDGTGTITVPGLGDITVPDWFPSEYFGQYYLPTAIKRITKGENLEDRGGGIMGPYWIQMNKYWEPSTP